MIRRAPQRRTQKERREGTIRKLLDAATETLIDVGYAEASVQRICARAGLSQGALFRHFATREALMVAVGEDVGGQLLERYKKKFDKLARGPGDVAPAAMRLVREMCRSRSNQALYELMSAARTNAALKKALQPIARRYHENIVRLARELLPEDATTLGDTFEAIITMILAVFDGETMHRFVLEQPRLEQARFDVLAGAVALLARRS
jgi:AcrR family transcriptional regulator